MVLDGAALAACCTKLPSLHQGEVRRASHGSALPGEAQGKKPRATNGSATGRHLISSLYRPPDGCDRGSGQERREREHGRECGEGDRGRQTSRFSTWATWLAACPPCMSRSPYSQSFRGGPARLLQEYPTLLGRRMAGRAALFRGHPTDMAPQSSNLHIGRLDPARAAPSLKDSCRHTHISPARPALRSHTHLCHFSSSYHPPSTIATASSLLQLQKDAFALGLTPCESATPAAVPLALRWEHPHHRSITESSNPHRHYCAYTGTFATSIQPLRPLRHGLLAANGLPSPFLHPLCRPQAVHFLLRRQRHLGFQHSGHTKHHVPHQQHPGHVFAGHVSLGGLSRRALC